MRPRGGVVTQRSAKPFTPVQFWSWPPINQQLTIKSSPAKSSVSVSSVKIDDGARTTKARTVAAIHYRKLSDSFQSRHEAGAVIGGWQWRAADRSCASRCGHSSRRGLGVAFVGALCRRIELIASQWL